MRVLVVVENSKSLMSPRTRTLALRSADRSFLTKVLTEAAWAWRWVSEERVGGWRWPARGSSPPLEAKWLAIRKTRSPRKVNSPASGLRLFRQAGSAGST
ncbi:hypothetical protein SF12_01870, partial [Streptomyces sp. MBRL 601]